MTMEQRQGLMGGRTVLVTGGSGGIGRSTALGLARMGADLAICGRDRESTGGAAVEVRAAGGGRVEVFVADLSSQAQVRWLAGEVLLRRPGLQPVQAGQRAVHLRAGQAAAGQLGDRQCVASRPDPHRLRGQDPAGVQRRVVPLLRPFMRSLAHGAATSIHLASAPELAQVTGRYVADRKPKRSAKASYDLAAAARLWQVSAELAGLTAAAEPHLGHHQGNDP
jgi:NAD(P)-dependent dehydrogenase (short-subunit alcohol dehydrogenase family)